MVDIWAGIDAGKREHHCVVIDADGTQLLSQRITNDEDTLLGGPVKFSVCGGV